MQTEQPFFGGLHYLLPVWGLKGQFNVVDGVRGALKGKLSKKCK